MPYKPTYSSMVLRGTRTKIMRSFGKKVTRPYMKEREIAIFSELLMKNKPGKVLEYGCGYSTVFYPKLLAGGAKWIAIEHSEVWSENINKQINHNNTVIYCIPPDHASYKDEGYQDDFDTYIRKANEFAPYDLILVDGMARESCIENAYNMLTPDGLVVVHDANRPVYREAMKKFPYVVIMEDFRKTAGGIAFLSKSHPIDYYVDYKQHVKSWKKGTFWGNFFKFKFLIGKPTKPFRLIASLD